MRYVYTGFTLVAMLLAGCATTDVEDTANATPWIEVAGGTFSMGRANVDVTISSLEVMRYEVTVAQFRKFSRTERFKSFKAKEKDRYPPYNRSPGGISPESASSKWPAIYVSWNDAAAYADWLTEKSNDGYVYRLPTESEWEYFARAGSTTEFWWGSVFEEDRANCAGCGKKSRTTPVRVGTYTANAFGIHDTAGNVWEWVQDCWSENHDNLPLDGSAITSSDAEDCAYRVARGGSWSTDSERVSSSSRLKWLAHGSEPDTGFRLVRVKTP